MLRLGRARLTSNMGEHPGLRNERHKIERLAARTNSEVLGGRRLILVVLTLFFLMAFSMFVPTSAAEAACTVPNQISNGQVADANAVMANFSALKDCADSAVTPSGTPATGSLSLFTSSNTVTSTDLSGDCTTAGSAATTCTKTNGSPFGYFATGTDAGQLTGTISVSRFGNGSNADASYYLRGDGVWAPLPSGGGGGGGGGNWWAGLVPHAADFTTAFSGGGSNPTIADDADLGLMVKSNNAGTGSFTSRGWAKPLPSGAWSAKAHVTANIYNGNYNGAGLYLFESGTSKFAANAIVYEDSAVYTDPLNGTLTGFSARGNRYPSPSTSWVRIDYDGSTNYTFYMSIDGKNWLTTRVIAKNSIFTNAATHIGLGVTIQNSFTDAANMGVDCDYWYQSW
jgi:hypothetical protein